MLTGEPRNAGFWKLSPSNFDVFYPPKIFFWIGDTLFINDIQKKFEFIVINNNISGTCLVKCLPLAQSIN